MRLGISTDTEDITGKIVSECADIPCEGKVKEAAESFVGKIMQVPPMYSALKVNGKKLCDIARRGGTVEREAREIEIFSLECEKINEREYALEIRASAGTYIRTLCADIGRALGCGAAMASLERRACGRFSIEDAHTLDEIEKIGQDGAAGLLIPVERLFEEYAAVTLPDFYARLAASGCEIYQSKIGTSFPVGERVRLYGNEGFFALGEVREYENGSAIKAIKQFVI